MADLNPLANPKGVKLLCELCNKPAFVQCQLCRVTYYCSREHQEADWMGIHEKICPLLIPLRSAAPFFSSDEARQKRQAEILTRQKELLELTLTTGSKLLFEGKYEQAVPAAMQALKFALDVYGSGSIELVPAYLILAESSIGLGKLVQAEEYLSQAQWAVLQKPDCSKAIRSKLNRNLGMLHAAEGNFHDALRYFSDDIYYSSDEFGTDSIQTAGGFFHMATVFHKQCQNETAESLYLEVTDIWFKHLDKIVQRMTKRPPTPKGLGIIHTKKEEPKPGLDEAQEAEARQVLHTIHELREREPPVNRDVYAKVVLTLAMLNFVMQARGRARDFASHALLALQGKEDSEVAPQILTFLKLIDVEA